jgi:syntaxin 1B/2/3
MNGDDPNRILNETRAIDSATKEIERDLDKLKMFHGRHLNSTGGDESSILAEIERQSGQLVQKYRALTGRVTTIKKMKESGNPRNAPQVGKVDRGLRTVIQKYQQADADYRRSINERTARDYRIVRPDASDAEVREATQDPNNTQVFSQAVSPIAKS